MNWSMKSQSADHLFHFANTLCKYASLRRDLIRKLGYIIQVWTGFLVTFYGPGFLQQKLPNLRNEFTTTNLQVWTTFFYSLWSIQVNLSLRNIKFTTMDHNFGSMLVNQSSRIIKFTTMDRNLGSILVTQSSRIIKFTTMDHNLWSIHVNLSI